MARRSIAPAVILRTAVICFIGCSVFPASWLRAEEPRERFAAHLAAGEFGPARKLAEQSGASRDKWMRQLAEAQAQGGAGKAALFTARDIQNDSQRQATYQSLLSNSPMAPAARGGAALADFDSLIELIRSTIAPDSWDEAGGTGAVEPFPGGVYVDARGTLKRVPMAAAGVPLTSLHKAAFTDSGNRNIRRASTLRKVSLTRLERQVQWLAAQGKKPNAAMQALAGMTRVRYVLIYPESRDIVLAGPAGDWTVDAEGRWVNAESNEPVLRLDDFVVLLRNAVAAKGRFTCSISPRQENLARVQEFLSESSKRPLKPGQRDEWLEELRDRLGPQDITVNGLDPQSHAARVIVEADYRMKLVGMGLEPGVLGVKSYLDSIEHREGDAPPPMDVLRWWFTLNYESFKRTAGGDAFELVGQGVKVLSENELLTERGERVHTGDAQHLNRLFAQNFTKHFPELAAKYPVYAELRNVFDLALVANLVHTRGLDSLCQWEMTHFGPQGQYQIERLVAPKEVASVLNYRQLDRRTFVVGVSGGVSVDAGPLVQEAAMKTDTYGLLSAERGSATPPRLSPSAWWWD